MPAKTGSPCQGSTQSPTSHNKSGSLVWLRRDLRLEDHGALHEALSCGQGPVYVVFVFDREILDKLENREDRRVEFIWESLALLQQAFDEIAQRQIIVQHGIAREIIPELALRLGVARVICARDYEPLAVERDLYVQKELGSRGIELRQVKDQVVFELQEVMTQGQRPYTVFTPYKNAWLKRLTQQDLLSHPSENGEALRARLAPIPADLQQQPSLSELGFKPTNLKTLKVPLGAPGAKALFRDFTERIGAYGHARDFPAIKGVSYLSVHLRFGTISVRHVARRAYEIMTAGGPNAEGASRWLSELIWRDFYFQILANFPHAAEKAFRPEYDLIKWDNDPVWFKAWCEAKTGYPIIDAAMEQLNQTGYMHNRLRMVVASFLTKDLGIDWRWGEAYFAKALIDFDLSANNGGWQWAASTGCDAQPYFRIFNPISQSEKFDPEGKFIRRYLPQLKELSNKEIHAPWLAKPLSLQAAGVELGKNYPFPIVEHEKARQRTLARFQVVKAKTSQ